MIGNVSINIEVLISGIVMFAAVFLLVTGGYTVLVEYFMPEGQQKAEGQSQPPSISIEDNLLQQFSGLVTPTDEAEAAVTKMRLIRAGYRRPSALRVFYLSRAVCAFAFALIGVAGVAFIKTQLPFPILILLLVFLFMLGFLAPPLWVDWRAKKRSQEAEQSFPDVLDMLLVCIEAGQSFDQACRRVTRDISGISKVLHQEFQMMSDELRAGRDRAAVFRSFAARLNVNDIIAFVTVLRQSDEFGVSIADALRVYAADMRNKRLMRAEEKANMMPLKLALGSMFFTVPPVMLVMAGPSFLMIMRVFSRMGGH